MAGNFRIVTKSGKDETNRTGEVPDAEEQGSGPGPADGAEDEVDEAGEESFPASDAPASWSGPPDS